MLNSEIFNDRAQVLEFIGEFPIRCDGIYTSFAKYNVLELNTSIYQLYNVIIPNRFSEMVSKRKCEFFAGRVCAQQALYKIANHNVSAVGIKEREPVWPSGYIGSITHTNQLAAACIAKSSDFTNIGIDIEPIIKIDICNSILNEVMNSHEINLLRLHYSKYIARDTFLTLIYSSKESIFKALFKDVQIFFSFDAISLVEITGDDIKFRLTRTLSPKWKKDDIIYSKYYIDKGIIYTKVAIKAN